MEIMEIINTILLGVLICFSTLVFLPIIFEKNNGIYRIFKNFNYSGIWFLKMFFKKQAPFKVKVILYSSCEVKTHGVQKIFGIGDFFHHNNSDRYGYIYEGNGKYGIYSYRYQDSKRIPEERLGTVKSGEPFFLEFHRSIVDKYKMGRYLYPYFEQDGVQEKGAPHTMKLKLEFEVFNYKDDFFFTYSDSKYNRFKF